MIIVSGNTITVTPRRVLPNLLDMSYFFTVFICVLYVCARSKACMGVSEDSWRRGFPSFTMWVLRMEFGSLGLVATPEPTE